MPHRTRTTTVIAAAVAALAVGAVGPTVSASPITDLIDSIGTGSAAPGTSSPQTARVRIEASAAVFRGFTVTRSPSASDSCVTITDGYGGRPVTNGYVVEPNTYNIWTVSVDDTKPGCGGYGGTTVGFTGGRGNAALTIEYGRGIAIACDARSSGERTCEQTYLRPDETVFRIS